MKTAMIARFVLGAAAIFAAAGLAGCGAGEQGSGESGAIGSTSEAITAGTMKDLNTLDTDTGTAGLQAAVGRKMAASCVLHDANVNPVRDRLIVIGGFNSTPAAIPDIYAYDPSADAWSLTGVQLATARGQLKAIQFPNDNTKCLIVGGAATEDGAAVVTSGSDINVEVLSLTGANTYSITHTSVAQLGTPRAKFELATCDDKIIAIGGSTSASGTTATGSIESFDPASPATAWASLTSLQAPRYDFALAKDLSGPANARFIVAGGDTGGGTQGDTIEVVTTGSVLTSKCRSTTTTEFAVNNNKKLFAAREKLVAFAKGGTTDTFLVAGGYTGAAASNLVDTVQVTDWTIPTIANTTHTTTDITATIAPMLVYAPTATKNFLMLGGESTYTTATFATGAAQEYTTSWQTAANLSGNGRVFGVVEFLAIAGGTSKAYATTGIALSSGTTFPTTGQSFTP